MVNRGLFIQHIRKLRKTFTCAMLMLAVWMAPGVVAAQLEEAKMDYVRVATFNVSMDATNYLPPTKWVSEGSQALRQALQTQHHQVRNIAEIIQRTRPHILVLNEFDYLPREQGIDVFLRDYLQVAQDGQAPIDYPYVYLAPVNTGQPSGFDLNRDGKVTAFENDAWGFGYYPGQYGMVVLSQFPIQTTAVRTFQQFKWQDMPGHLVPKIPTTGEPWYSADVMEKMPLSSKSHWDVPIDINGTTVHVLVSHPTPPVFDGPENRNGIKNHDEVRFWADYINQTEANYIYDDNGERGGLKPHQRFIIAGDLNASIEGTANVPGTIEQLLEHPLIQAEPIPTSEGGMANSNSPYAAQHTATWGKRADYLLPSLYGIKVQASGVFWPLDNELAHLFATRDATSDHRLVWLDIELR